MKTDMPAILRTRRAWIGLAGILALSAVCLTNGSGSAGLLGCYNHLHTAGIGLPSQDLAHCQESDNLPHIDGDIHEGVDTDGSAYGVIIKGVTNGWWYCNPGTLTARLYKNGQLVYEKALNWIGKYQYFPLTDLPYGPGEYELVMTATCGNLTIHDRETLQVR